VSPALRPKVSYRTPAASSSPWSATFIINGLITPPYEQRRVMRSAGLLALVTAMLAFQHCA